MFRQFLKLAHIGSNPIEVLQIGGTGHLIAGKRVGHCAFAHVIGRVIPDRRQFDIRHHALELGRDSGGAVEFFDGDFERTGIIRSEIEAGVVP